MLYILSGFLRDEFTSLPDDSDRILCANIYCKYWYKDEILDVDYSGVWLVTFL